MQATTAPDPVHRRCPRVVAFLSRFDWLLLALLAPVLLYPERFEPSLVGFALLALVSLWFVRLWATRHFFPTTPLDVPLLCLLLTVPLSLHASVDFATSLPRLTGLLFGIAIFFVTARASASRQTWLAVLAIWLASADAIALLGLVTTDWLSKSAILSQVTARLPHIVTALTSTREGGLHPNEAGGLMALFVPLTLSVCLTCSRAAAQSDIERQIRPAWLQWISQMIDPGERVGRTVWICSMCLLVALLVLSQSRSALFGTAAAVGFVGMVRSKYLRYLVPMLCVAALATVIITSPQTIADNLFGGEGIASGAVGTPNLAEREEIWGRALNAIKDFPFTGVGLNQFEHVVNTLYPLFLAGPDAQFTHAHDLYLQIAVDYGLGGLVAYGALLTAAGVAAARAYRVLADGLERSVVLGLAAGLLGYQIFGLSDSTPLGAKPTFEWWLFVGMITGLYTYAGFGAYATQHGLRISKFDAFLMWVLTSLLAIIVVTDNALLSVGLAILGGCAVGMGGMLADSTTIPILPDS